MSRAESPFYPPMTHMLNVPPSIPDWRRSNRKIIGPTEFERSQFKLIEPPQRRLADGCYVEISGCTKGAGQWLTTINPDVDMFLFPQAPLPPSDINSIAELLTIQQSPYIPSGGEKPHADAINFLMRNWKELRFDMYPQRPKDTVPPYRFSEVLVDSSSNVRADFVGIGPDGRIIVIEFGVSGKHEQVLGYKAALEKLFDDFDISITPMVAYYSNTTNVRKVHIKPAYKDHMHSGAESARQFLKRDTIRKKNNPPDGWLPSSLHEFETFVRNYQEKMHHASKNS